MAALAARDDGAVVVGMILQHDVADVDGGGAGSMAEVEHELHGLQVLTLEVALPEHVGLAGLQADVGHVDDGVGVGLVRELHGDAVDVGISQEDAREVVVVGGRRAHVGGVQMQLCLPAVGACVGHGDGVVVVAALIHSLHLRSAVRAPAGSEVEGSVGRDTLPQVEVARSVEARLLYQPLFGRAGEHVAPGNRAVGRLVEQHHLRVCELFYAEQGVLILRVAADVGEGRVGSQPDVLASRGDDALGVGPVERLEVPGSRLVADGHVDVGIVVLGAPGGASLVHVGKTVGTGVVGIGAALASVGREGDAVVVDAEVLLVVHSGAPPCGCVGSGRAAAHVAYLLAVDAPIFARDAAEVGTPVYLGLIEREGLADARLADAVAVANAQLDGVGAGFGVGVAHLLQGGVARAVDDPHGVSALCGGVAGHHLVGFLVDGHLELSAADGGNAVGIGTGKLVGRAGREQDKGDSEYFGFHNFLSFLSFLNRF